MCGTSAIPTALARRSSSSFISLPTAIAAATDSPAKYEAEGDWAAALGAYLSVLERNPQDDAARKQYYDQVQQALNGELPYVWLYHVVWAIGARPDVGGLSEPQALGFGRTDAKPWWTDIWLKS